jgi:hypothetical protein
MRICSEAAFPRPTKFGVKINFFVELQKEKVLAIMKKRA